MTTKQRLIKQVQDLADKDSRTYTEDDSIIEIKFIVGTDLTFKDVIVIVGTGGPHLEFRSDNQSINGYWGSESATCYYDDWREVHDYWEDYYNMLRRQ